MQSVLIDDKTLDTMPEKPIDILILQRLEQEQKDTASRVGGLDKSVQSLGREISEIKGGIRAPAETPAWIRFFVYPACVLIAGSMVTAVIMLLVKVNGIETFIHDNGGFIAGLRLQQSASDPSNQRSAVDAQQILKTAKKNRITIPVDVVGTTGTKFLDVSQSNSKAWDTALAFLDYRSYLNGPNPPSLSAYYALGGRENPDHLETFYLNVKFPEGAKPPQFTSSFARVDIAVSARIDRIGNPLPQTAKQGAASVLGIGGVLALGEMYLRHVVLYDVEIHYEGGPVILDDVTFINCRFVMDENKDSRALANQILTARSIRFNA